MEKEQRQRDPPIHSTQIYQAPTLCHAWRQKLESVTVHVADLAVTLGFSLEEVEGVGNKQASSKGTETRGAVTPSEGWTVRGLPKGGEDWPGQVGSQGESKEDPQEGRNRPGAG